MSPAAALAIAWLGFVAGATAWAAARAKPPRRTHGRSLSGVAWLVRPCAGREDGLARRLARCPAPVARVVFAVASEDDEARPAADEARASLAREGLDARVVITRARGPNAKADQLARALEGADADVVVVADSDVAIAPGDLEALLAPLEDPGVAASWAAPVEIAPATGADRASAAVLAASLHAFPLLSALDPGCFVGKLFAIRARALEAAGGFAALRAHLGEDMELARRLRAHGLRVTRAPIAARSEARGRTWPAVIARYARWVSVIRAQRSALVWSYPLLFVPTAPLLALCLAAARSSPALGLALVTVTIALRVATVAIARAHAGVGSALARAHAGVRGSALAFLRDAALADALLWAAWGRALTRRTVTWRGAELRVERGGTLSRTAPDA